MEFTAVVQSKQKDAVQSLQPTSRPDYLQAATGGCGFQPVEELDTFGERFEFALNRNHRYSPRIKILGRLEPFHAFRFILMNTETSEGRLKGSQGGRSQRGRSQHGRSARHARRVFVATDCRSFHLSRVLLVNTMKRS